MINLTYFYGVKVTGLGATDTKPARVKITAMQKQGRLEK